MICPVLLLVDSERPDFPGAEFVNSQLDDPSTAVERVRRKHMLQSVRDQIAQAFSPLYSGSGALLSTLRFIRSVTISYFPWSCGTVQIACAVVVFPRAFVAVAVSV